MVKDFTIINTSFGQMSTDKPYNLKIRIEELFKILLGKEIEKMVMEIKVISEKAKKGTIII